jgi:hypothetical protein
LRPLLSKLIHLRNSAISAHYCQILADEGTGMFSRTLAQLPQEIYGANIVQCQDWKGQRLGRPLFSCILPRNFVLFVFTFAVAMSWSRGRRENRLSTRVLRSTAQNRTFGRPVFILSVRPRAGTRKSNELITLWN